MSSKFVISHLEEQMGPFDEAELKARWAKGDLLPIDYVYDDVKQDWVLMSERFPWAQDVKELEEEAPPPIAEAANRRRPAQTSRVKADIRPAPNGAPTLAPVAAPSPTATPAVAFAATATTPAIAPTPAPAPAPAQIKLVNGEGELELPGQLPGEVELNVQDPNSQLTNKLKIQIKSAEPQLIEWTVPAQQTVGEDVEILVRALDGANRVCSNYDDTFSIHVGGSESHQLSVTLKQGQASLRIQHTKAETWALSFHYSGQRVLKLPQDKNLEWQPGPATKLVLDGPEEYSAGYPLKVSVRAVDRFGNLAKTFQGTLVLEVVKAS